MKFFRKLLLISCFAFMVTGCNLFNNSSTPSEVEKPSTSIESDSSKESSTVESSTVVESSTPEQNTSSNIDASSPSESTIPSESTNPSVEPSSPSESSTPSVEPSSPSESSTPEESTSTIEPFVDYVAQTKLDLTDETKLYAEVTVSLFIDGDTTHFSPKGQVPEHWVNTEKNILKARYNSCDTPESTGKVEPWGESAKQFTKKALSNAHSIIIQSDTDSWNTDSTGDRYLVWVWYQPEEGADYRLLNLELVQEGLAKLKSASSFSLYETFFEANRQAIVYQKCVYSTEKDPNFYYGKAQVITIKDLRNDPEKYKNKKVCVNGVITIYDTVNHMAYAQSYDVDTDKWYGIDVYLGFNSYEIIKPGNYLRLVGTLGYYENGNSWQLTGLSYHRMNPDYEGSMKLLEKNVEYAPIDVTADDITGNTANNNWLEKGDLLQSVYAKFSGLTVQSVYTTSSTDSTSNGAMTLTCVDENGKQVTVRTSVLKKEDGTLLAKADVINKTISAVGIITSYNGEIQLHVFKLSDLEIA